MKKESRLMTIWKITYPMMIYVLVQNIVTIFATVFYTAWLTASYAVEGIEKDTAALTEEVLALYMENALVFLLISSLICLPLFYFLYKHAKKQTHVVRRNIPMQSKDILAIILASAALSTFLNNAIAISPLPTWFPEYYEETAEMLFSGGIVLQVIEIGVLACIVEELLFRGIAYRYIHHRWGRKAAVFATALLFGIYHFNVVQAVYAGLLGLFMAWLVERYDTLWASVISHMSANLLSVFLTANPGLDFIYESLVGFCLVTCGSVLIFYYMFRWMKDTDPLVELEFVEKEPDTLQGLSEEYHGNKKNPEDEIC